MADVSLTTTPLLRLPDTSSRCPVETVTATHDFEVSNFSQLDGLIGAGRSVNSAPFDVGGFSWTIKFFPDGCDDPLRCCCVRVASAYVAIGGGAVGARAKFTLSLVDRHGKLHWRRRTSPRTFGWPQPTSWGFENFYLKPFMRLFSRRLLADDDCLKIRCELTVLTPPRTENTTPAPAPAPELQRHLHALLADGTGADVTFAVAGREFRAHRVMLAARSPVFRAELYGAMAENDPGRVIEIVDVEPAVFEMLLDFIYTDSLPGGVDGGHCAATMQHLLVAADRYGLDRLKLMCAEKLHRSIDVTNVTATLALADQHHCQLLKEACITFLSSPKNLRLVVATDEFKQLMAICPMVLSGNLDGASSEKK